jgi:hypothetical protein
MIKEEQETNSQIKGSIVVAYRDKETNATTKVQEKSNLITYGGADILAKLASGDSRFAINGMYFQFKNGSTSSSDLESITRASDKTFFESLSSPSDWMRVPIITNGKLDKTNHQSSSNIPFYSSNQVTFVATTAATEQFGVNDPSLPFSQSSPHQSKIQSVALVAMPDKNNRLNDVIFSRSNLASPIPALNSSYIDVFWTLSFL